MKRTPFIVLAIIGLFAAAVAIGWFYYQANPEEWDSFLNEMGGESSASSAPKPVKQSSRSEDDLQASGSIEVNEVILSTLSAGKVIEVYVGEGQNISSGDLLLQIDERPLQAQRSALMANVDQAIAAKAVAQAYLDMTLAGPRSEEIAVAEGAVRAAAAQVDIARAGLAAVESAILLGLDSNTPTEHDLAAAEAQIEMAEGHLEQAQAQLVMISTGATIYNRAILEAQVEQADATLAAAEAAVQSIDIEIENTSVLSPIDGVIIQRLINPGEIAAPAAALFLIADLDELTLTVFVPEAELGKVKLGQRAHVSVDAYEHVFEGVVTHIASSAEFTPRNVQTQEERVHMVFAVKVSLDNDDGLLRPGMPADATFVADDS
ncbi:MAG: efflux RND transporter periplasmic adaptor subunit [Candidatus Promineifilaceae bacterium]